MMKWQIPLLCLIALAPLANSTPPGVINLLVPANEGQGGLHPLPGVSDGNFTAGVNSGSDPHTGMYCVPCAPDGFGNLVTPGQDYDTSLSTFVTFENDNPPHDSGCNLEAPDISTKGFGYTFRGYSGSGPNALNVFTFAYFSADFLTAANMTGPACIRFYCAADSGDITGTTIYENDALTPNTHYTPTITQSFTCNSVIFVLEYSSGTSANPVGIQMNDWGAYASAPAQLLSQTESYPGQFLQGILQGFWYAFLGIAVVSLPLIAIYSTFRDG